MPQKSDPPLNSTSLLKHHPTDQLFDQDELSTRWHKSPRTLERWRMNGAGPPYIKLGAQVRYRESDAELWLRSRTFTHTAAVPKTRKAPRRRKSR